MAGKGGSKREREVGSKRERGKGYLLLGLFTSQKAKNFNLLLALLLLLLLLSELKLDLLCVI